MTDEISESEDTGPTLDDLPETVFVKGGSAGKRVFHTSKTCTACPDTIRCWDTELALEWGMRPCIWCVDEESSPGGNQQGKGKDLYNHLLEIGKTGGTSPADD